MLLKANWILLYNFAHLRLSDRKKNERKNERKKEKRKKGRQRMR